MNKEIAIPAVIFGWIQQEAQESNMLLRTQVKIGEDLKRGLGVVIFDQGRPVAYCRVLPFRKNLIEVASLVVDPEKRRRGYGTLAVENAFEMISSRFPNSQVFCLARNAVSQALFAKIGGRKLKKEELPDEVWQLCTRKGVSCSYGGDYSHCPCVAFDLTHLVGKNSCGKKKNLLY